jgi:hypothetical protein
MLLATKTVPRSAATTAACTGRDLGFSDHLCGFSIKRLISFQSQAINHCDLTMFSKHRTTREECQFERDLQSIPAEPASRVALPACAMFSPRRHLKGNQLAVFEDAGELTTAEMQKLANETNLSETTFILRRDPATERREGVRVRIFTTQEELPFAGHPTLGTAVPSAAFFPSTPTQRRLCLI